MMAKHGTTTLAATILAAVCAAVGPPLQRPYKPSERPESPLSSRGKAPLPLVAPARQVHGHLNAPAPV